MDVGKSIVDDIKEKGVNVKGSFGVFGTQVFTADGDLIPYIRSVEYLHVAGEVPTVIIRCFASEVDVHGVPQIVKVCPNCESTQSELDRLKADNKTLAGLLLRSMLKCED